MVNIVCEKCYSVLQDNFKLINLNYNHKAKPGDTITISGQVECLNTIFAGDIRVCLYNDNNDQLMDSTAQQTLNPWDKKPFKFEFVMPDESLQLNLSLLGQNVFTYDCEDFKTIIIEKSNYTEPVIPDSWNFTYILIGVGLIGVALLFRAVNK